MSDVASSSRPHPVFQAIIDAYAAANRPFLHQVSPTVAREMLRASMMAAPKPGGLAGLEAVVDAVVDGPNGPIPIRRYMPSGRPLGVCVYLHAGGWVIGNLDFSDTTCRRLAAASQCEFISVDYRLAPEHPFPQPLDDAYAVLEWAAASRPGPVLVVGESAGANLAAACAIRARDCNGPRLVGQVLAYPVTDHDFTTGSYQEVGEQNWLLSTADMRYFWDHYAPSGVDRSDPLISPLRVADPGGLPAALVVVAELDPLRDEGLAYADRLAMAGIAVATRCDAGMVHGYLGAAGAIPLAAEALADISRWIRSAAGQAG